MFEPVDGVHLPLINRIVFFCFSLVAQLALSAPESPTSFESDAMAIEEAAAHRPYGVSNLVVMRAREKAYRLNNPFYIDNQLQITEKMRRDLVIWLLNFCNEQNMRTETAHLAVSHIDRYASGLLIYASKFELVGLTALFMASKVEEMEDLDLTDLLESSGKLFAQEDVLQMEKQMTEYLKFKLHVPTSLNFVNEFDDAADLQPEVRTMSQYLVDLALVEGRRFLGYLPSKTAAAAIAVARIHQDMALWSDTLEEITGYNIDQLRNPIIALSKMHVKTFGNENSAIYRQYSSREFIYVSTVRPHNITGLFLDQIAQDSSRFKSENDSTPRGELMFQLADE